MKLFTSIILILTPIILFSQDLNSISSKTAILNDAKHLEIGLFQPIRYSITRNWEIATHPIAFFMSPNLQLKKAYKSSSELSFASQHTIYYPTPLLKMISREGTGGIIAEEFKDDFPQMFSLYNGILISKQVNDKHLVTLKTGVKFAINSGDLDSRTSIDLPLVFQRLQVFHEGFGLQYGFNVVAHIKGNFYSDANFEIFHFPGSDENLAIEYSSMYSWMKSDKTQLSLGFKVIWGNYPFGSQTHLLPMFDIKWKIR